MLISSSRRQRILLIIMFILVMGTDTFVVFANEVPTFKYLFQSLLGIVAVYVALKTRCFSRKSLMFAILMIGCVALTMFCANDFSGGNYIKIILLGIGVIIVNGISLEEFKKTYINVMLIICIFSLVTYLCSFIIRDYGILPIIRNTSNVRMVFLGLSNICIGGDAHRNYGPFWEPGVYAAYLSLGVLFLFTNEKKIDKRVLVLCIGILTTLSTAGFLYLLILLGYYTVAEKRDDVLDSRKGYRFLVMIAILLLAVVFVMFNDRLSYALFSKLNKNNYEYISTVARLASISGNIDIWRMHPMVGIGPTKLQDAFEHYLFARGYLANSNTNGLLIAFSMYGTLMGCCLIYGLAKFSGTLDMSRKGRFIIFVLLICMMFSEPLTTSCLFNIIIFYGMTELGERRVFNNEYNYS